MVRRHRQVRQRVRRSANGDVGQERSDRGVAESIDEFGQSRHDQHEQIGEGVRGSDDQADNVVREVIEWAAPAPRRPRSYQAHRPAVEPDRDLLRADLGACEQQHRDNEERVRTQIADIGDARERDRVEELHMGDIRDVASRRTDASLIAIAERLGVTRVATLDRAQFTVVKPAHCDAFELVSSERLPRQPGSVP